MLNFDWQKPEAHHLFALNHEVLALIAYMLPEAEY